MVNLDTGSGLGTAPIMETGMSGTLTLNPVVNGEYTRSLRF
jgi:hypothetical protein